MKNAMYDAARKHGASFLKNGTPGRPLSVLPRFAASATYYMLSGGKQPFPGERAAHALNRMRGDDDYGVERRDIDLRSLMAVNEIAVNAGGTSLGRQ